MGVFPGSDGCEEGAGPFACSGTSHFSSLTGFRSPSGAQRASCWSSAEQRHGVQTPRRGSMFLLVSHSSHTERDKGGISAVCVVVLHQPDLDSATFPQQVQSGGRIPYTGTRTCLGVHCLMLLETLCTVQPGCIRPE